MRTGPPWLYAWYPVVDLRPRPPRLGPGDDLGNGRAGLAGAERRPRAAPQAAAWTSASPSRRRLPGPTRRRSGPSAARSLRSLAAGLLMIGTYMLILLAFAIAPLAGVAPLREATTILAAAWARSPSGSATGPARGWRRRRQSPSGRSCSRRAAELLGRRPWDRPGGQPVACPAEGARCARDSRGRAEGLDDAAFVEAMTADARAPPPTRGAPPPTRGAPPPASRAASTPCRMSPAPSVSTTSTASTSTAPESPVALDGFRPEPLGNEGGAWKRRLEQVAATARRRRRRLCRCRCRPVAWKAAMQPPGPRSGISAEGQAECSVSSRVGDPGCPRCQQHRPASLRTVGAR